MFKKYFSAFHLNQASTTLCSPFPTETLDVQLQVCRIQRHSTLFLNPNPVPTSVRTANTWEGLFLCPYSVGIWHDSQMSFLPAPLALRRVKYVPSAKEEQSSVAAEHSGLCLLGVRVKSLSSKGHLPHISPCQSSFYRSCQCWPEQRDFE